MHAGFLLHDEYGRIQVVDNAKDIFLIDKDDVNINGTSDNVKKLKYGEPIFALQPNDKNTGIFFKGYSPQGSGLAGSGKVFYFGYNRSPLIKGFGLEVFDENSELTFSSNLLSINVIDHVKANVGDLRSNGNFFLKKDYGNRSVAVIPNKLPFAITSYINPIADTNFITIGFYLGAKKGEIIAKPVLAGKGPPIEFGYNGGSELDFLVIDVGHY